MTYSPPAGLLTSLGLSVPAGVWTTGAVFPLLQGQDIEITRTPIMSSSVKTAASGRERRTAFWSYPRWRFQVRQNVIRDRAANPELGVLEAFFLTAQGMVSEFNYFDPDQYSVTGQAVATGNGSRTVFQLVRTIEGYTEPVLAPYTATAVISVNGTPTAVTHGTYGQITFASAPANGAAITWTGLYYFRCRLEQDELAIRKMFSELWSVDKLSWISVKR